MGVGAWLTPTLAGYVTDRFGSPAALSPRSRSSQ